MTVTNLARFTINGTPSEDVDGKRGYDAEAGETLTLTLERNPALGVSTVTYSLHDAFDTTSPLNSLYASNLAFSDRSKSVTTSAVNSAFDVEIPEDADISSYIFRASVVTATGQEVFERMVCIRHEGYRMTVPAETVQYSQRGWSDALNEAIKLIFGAVAFLVNNVAVSFLDTARGIAYKITGNRVSIATAVANVAALRADASLITAGSIRLDCHTYPGFGGGDLWWDSVSTDADNNGTIFAVAGVTTGRWKRTNPSGLLTDWGADPSGVVAADTSWDSCANWIATQNGFAALRIPSGKFLMQSTHSITASRFTVIGEGYQTSVLWADLPSGANLFEFSTGVTGLRMSGFAIRGGANCGRAAFDLSQGTACWYTFDVKLVMGGNWQYWLYANCDPLLVNRGGFQWGTLDLSNFQDSWGEYQFPVNGVYVEGGYFNCCEMRIQGIQVSGDTVHIEQMTLYSDGNYGLKITGNAQTGGRGIYLKEGAYTIIENWMEEENDTFSHIEGLNNATFNAVGFGHQVNLLGVTASKFSHVSGRLNKDANCHSNDFEWCGSSTQDPIPRYNVSDTGRGGMVCFGVNGQIPASFGQTNPENILLNGDMTRWLASGVPWGFAGNYSATQCGDGFADTTRTRDCKYSALCTDDPGMPTSPWYWRAFVAPALDQSLLHTPIVVTLKYKAGSGTTADPQFCIDSADVVTSDFRPATLYSPFECEPGWFLVTVSYLITQDIIDHGAALFCRGENGTSYYITEVTATIGNVAPRHYFKCIRSPFLECTISENGSLLLAGDEAPSGSNDPIFNGAWITGDTIFLRNPVEEISSGGLSFSTLAYSYTGTTWLPQQVLTGLEAVS